MRPNGITLERAAAVEVVARAGGGVCAFGSIDHPDDRLPQWTQRRNIDPGSHHIP
jgi:hypothetical protein